MPRTRQQTQAVSPDVVDLTETPSTATDARKRKRVDDELEQSASPEVSASTEATHTRIGAMSCIICMESYTNATVAHCGHIFCHECLIRALTASEASNNRGQGVCPSCRKPISRKRANQIIPINFMKKSKFRRRQE